MNQNDPVTALVNGARRLLNLVAGSSVDRALIERAVANDEPGITAMTGHVFSDAERAEAMRRLEAFYVVEQGKALFLRDEKRPPQWYLGERRKPGDFMQKYLQKLAEDDWPRASLEELQDSTARVLDVLDDPQREGPWDWRGLVVGDVQSGKTAHYAGVINRAADAGYRVIVVLAGMHDVLRLQTQKRLDQDFLGHDTDPRKRKGGSGGRTPIGVGLIPPRKHVDSVTTAQPKGDFNQVLADGVNFALSAHPFLFVVKKNHAILKNLNRWIKRLPDESRQVPLLVIDDEADQASVDTGDQPQLPDGSFDPDYDPKRVNGEIRKLLASFDRAAYVGYTATPFANILIHDERGADGYGPDLFPSTFIVSLTPPDDYFGPVAVFGTNDGESPGLPLIRYVEQTDEGWIPDRHDKTLRPRWQGRDEIPPSLERAIDAFLLSCAARAARGQVAVHNSMLVHVSRFVDVHAAVHAQVDHYLHTTTAMISGGDMQTLSRLQAMWEDDFEPTTASMRSTVFDRQLAPVTWEQVRAQLADSADKIEVLIANGSRKSDIDYDSYKDTGRSLIAIGGDKLSRGLTLEGLSVSYFLRLSRQYDSLLQMGRWFGYRRRFADLCRLYTTSDMEDWFTHVATATRDLRAQFAHMQLMGDATPKDYGLRVEAHSVMNVTASNKQRHGTERASSYAGEGKIQTVFFRNPDLIASNVEAVDAFLAELDEGTDGPARPRGGKAGGMLWKDVAGASVASLLSRLHFPSENTEIEGGALSEFIRNQIADHNELTGWTVFVPSGDGSPVTLGGRTFGSVKRVQRKERQTLTRYIVRTILSPEDEAIDLTKDQYDLALTQTNEARAEAGENLSDRPSGPSIRRIRGQHPEKGLLILYPLDPVYAEIEGTDQPVIGVMISFPESETARKKIYLENVVRTRELEQ